MFGCGEKRHALGTASRYPKYLGVRGDAPHSAMGSKAIVVSLLTLQLSTATSQIMLCYPLSESLCATPRSGSRLTYAARARWGRGRACVMASVPEWG